VLALGGGAVETEAVRTELRERALTVLLEVDPEVAWSRVRGGDRPLAQDEEEFRALFEARQPLYREAAEAIARDADDVVLAAGAVSRGPVVADADCEIVADERVLELHEPPVERRATLTVPPGEAAKSVETAERLWRELRLDRGGTLVAFGGGCATDVAGFVAATYLRGIDWIAVPTTLVAQVDAAIGGKTGINLAEGKNLVGAFHWPRQTVLEVAYLATLPASERRAGMAEVVKTGLLAGEPFWRLEEAELVRRCAAYKTALCLRDPYDRGPRQALNLGHTFAHALEAASGYELAHGDAVALGLLAALRLSDQPTDDVEEILRPEPVPVDRERAWEALGRDKKASGGRVRLVLLERPGRPLVGAELPDEQVRAALDSLIAS
jgi:3-dehydroquinate synthetase